MLSLPLPVRLRLSTHLQEVARVIGMDASLWPRSVGLRLGVLEWKDAGAVSKAILAFAQECCEEPLFAPTLAGTVSTAVSHPSAEWQPETLLEVSDQVADKAPLVAVELVRIAGERLHWREDAAKRLRTLREHPRPAIRTAARAITTARE